MVVIVIQPEVGHVLIMVVNNINYFSIKKSFILCVILFTGMYTPLYAGFMTVKDYKQMCSQNPNGDFDVCLAYTTAIINESAYSTMMASKDYRKLFDYLIKYEKHPPLEFVSQNLVADTPAQWFIVNSKTVVNKMMSVPNVDPITKKNNLALGKINSIIGDEVVANINKKLE
jgi:hypothetical protein